MLLRVQLLEVLGVLLNPGHPFSLSSVVSLMQTTPSSLDVLDAAMKYGEKIFKKQFLKALSCVFLFFLSLKHIWRLDTKLPPVSSSSDAVVLQGALGLAEHY